MIKRRPTFATGHSLAGLPAVNKVLHTDERSELYSLTSAAGSETILLLVRGPDATPPDVLRLEEWWATQPPQLLTVKQVLRAEECPLNSIASVLALSGRRLEHASLREEPQESLMRLFHAMLDAVDRGLLVQMLPDFSPSLTWLAIDEAAVCSLLPLEGPVPDEREIVRIVARAFYLFATGIAYEQEVSEIPALQRWAKFGGEDLSRIVDRCLSTSNSKSCITTLSGLNDAVGRAKAEGIESQLPACDHHSTLASSAAGQGLDKVAGMHALKDLLRREVIDPVRNPEPYRQYGLSIPNGILLYGPPGCGKTHIARQLAEELGHYFVEIIPSELASPYIHQSVMRIRELFDSAAEQAPAVVFIDEFEALVPSREGLGGHQQYKSEEVNEFLAHLNSCSEKGIFVIAATNQPQKIDPAVRRTGRLDKLIYVGPPDLEARREMLAFHLEGRPLAPDTDIEALAETVNGYSASDLRFLVDEAARDALRIRQPISSQSFKSAMARIQPSVTSEIEAQYQSIEQRGF
jgi:AAA+ superfamily predicted ATPase